MGKITDTPNSFHVCDRCGTEVHTHITQTRHTWVKFTQKSANYEIEECTGKDRLWLCPSCTDKFLNFMDGK